MEALQIRYGIEKKEFFHFFEQKALLHKEFQAPAGT